ncbi:MAG: hypothetical protein HUJ69_08535 [Lachnospiraceae bacterium]|nr:hypothetical protein [Lachnospiraceae bacterium]
MTKKVENEEEIEGCASFRRIGVTSENWIPYQVKMMPLTAGLLPFRWEGETLLFAAEEDLESLTEWIRRRPSAGQVRELITAVCDLSEELDRYLLDERRVPGDSDCIWWSPDTGSFRFLYVPAEGKARMFAGDSEKGSSEAVTHGVEVVFSPEEKETEQPLLHRVLWNVWRKASALGWSDAEAVMELFRMGRGRDRENAEPETAPVPGDKNPEDQSRESTFLSPVVSSKRSLTLAEKCLSLWFSICSLLWKWREKQ